MLRLSWLAGRCYFPHSSIRTEPSTLTMLLLCVFGDVELSVFEYQQIAPLIPGIAAAYAILFVGASSPGPSVALLVGIATEQVDLLR